MASKAVKRFEVAEEPYYSIGGIRYKSEFVEVGDIIAVPLGEGPDVEGDLIGTNETRDAPGEVAVAVAVLKRVQP